MFCLFLQKFSFIVRITRSLDYQLLRRQGKQNMRELSSFPARRIQKLAIIDQEKAEFTIKTNICILYIYSRQLSHFLQKFQLITHKYSNNFVGQHVKTDM